MLLEISKNSQENNCARVKPKACNFIIKKEALTQVLSSEICEISNNSFFTDTSRGCFWIQITVFASSVITIILWLDPLCYKTFFFSRIFLNENPVNKNTQQLMTSFTSEPKNVNLLEKWQKRSILCPCLIILA